MRQIHSYHSITTLTCALHKEVITVNRNAAAVGNNTDTVTTNYGYVGTVDGQIYRTLRRLNAF